MKNKIANIEKIKSEIKPWKAYNGSLHYYVNDWRAMINLEVTKYNTGNVKHVTHDGASLSNNYYNKKINPTKVWFDEEAVIHVDYCRCDDVEKDIRQKVVEYYSA